MAQTYKTFCKSLLLLTLVLFMSMAETKKIIGFGKRVPTVRCNAVYGTEIGESCSSVAEDFGLSLEEFLGINPNINCNEIFVGQWLCVDGSISN